MSERGAGLNDDPPPLVQAEVSRAVQEEERSMGEKTPPPLEPTIRPYA